MRFISATAITNLKDNVYASYGYVNTPKNRTLMEKEVASLNKKEPGKYGLQTKMILKEDARKVFDPTNYS